MSVVFLIAACLAQPNPEKPMPPTIPDIQSQVAGARHVDVEDVRVSPLATPVVPGVQLYRVVVGGESWSSALVVEGRVLVDPGEKRAAIARAWGYGAARTVPAQDVAEAMLLTLDLDEEPKLVTDPARASYLARLGVEGVSVPAETTEDGVPGVRFWYGTGENPATEVIAIFKRDGEVELRAGRTHGGG